jgi:sugar phosphate isomerase/epimerase
VGLAQEIGAHSVELHHPWLAAQTTSELARLGDDLAGLGITPIVSAGLTHQPGETLEEPIRCARAVGATVVRLGLTPVLEGARAAWGPRWNDMRTHASTTLVREAPRAEAAGLVLAIEDHQDFGSEELVALAEEAGGQTGVVLDTGNPFAVGEDPVAFTRRAAHRIRHVHLKDYRAQFTGEGYRLVRCAIGDGSVPLDEIVAELPADLTASLEPGALEARHIRLFTADWWRGYPPRDARELAIAVGRLRGRRLADDEDWRTPWERGAPGPEIVDYEIAQMRRGVEHMRARGWMRAPVTDGG